MKKSLLLLLFSIALISVQSCGEKWIKVPGGVQYKVLKYGDPKKKIEDGSYISVYLINKTENDSVVYDGHKRGLPQKLMVHVSHKSDGIMTGLLQLHEGDSVLFILPSDSFFRDDASRPPYIRKHSALKIIMAIVKVDSKDNYEKAREEAMRQQQEELEQSNNGAPAPGAEAEDKMIQDYLKKKGITNATKTASGMYYVITQKGYGDVIKKGQTAVMNYTGRLMDDSAFDSNVDPKFNHAQPFQFAAGIGQVIDGWNEGVLLLNKSAKAKWIIPSYLGYGAQSPGPGIPPNSILVFDVELADIR